MGAERLLAHGGVGETMALTKLATVDEIPEKGMAVKKHGDRQVMLAMVKGQIYAMDNVCTHKGAPLNEGELGGPKGDDPLFLTCPWHEAHFDVRTGKVYQDTPWATDTNVFRVEVRGKDVYVDL